MPIGQMRYQNQPHRLGRDYSKKNLENPFRKTKQGIKRDEISARIKFSCVLFLLLLVGFLYLMFFSSVFNLRTVKISGLSRLDPALVEKLVWQQSGENRYWLFRQENLLVFDKDQLAQTLETNYHFRDIKIKKSLFHTLKISLAERELRYIWQEQDKYFYIDQEAYLVSELILDLPPALVDLTATTTATTTATSTEENWRAGLAAAKRLSQNNYPIIVNQDEGHLLEDRVDIDTSYFSFISLLQEKIKANNEPELSISYILLDKEFNTIKAVLDSGLTIYFSTKEDWDKQVRNLLVLKKEMGSDFNNKIKKKIDLRYGGTVYYE